MEITERYRRSLKRKNYSSYTIKNYMNRIDHFTLWLRVPLEKVTRKEMGAYVDHLLRKRLSPKTITCHLQTLHLFFEYLIDEEKMAMDQPHQPRIDTSAEAPSPVSQGRTGGQALCRHPGCQGQGHVHAHAPLRACGWKRLPILPWMR